MNAIVVYESMYGNTRAVAEAIAEGLGGARVLAVGDAGNDLPAVDLTVVGGPTHMHGMSTSLSRRMAVEGAKEDGADTLEPSAAEGPGLRSWLRELPTSKGALAAAFDTRLDKPPAITGVAARGIWRRLRHRGYEVLSSESFLVQDTEGPLADGELDRARAWGAQLAEQTAARNASPEPSRAGA